MKELRYNPIKFFERLTNFLLSTFLSDYNSFIENQKNLIFDFYSGRSTDEVDAFNELNRLIDQVKDILNLFQINTNSFVRTEDWDLLESIERIETDLSTILNSYKYLKSTRSKFNYNQNVAVKIYNKKYQTLESIARENLGSNNDSDWVEIALQNNLSEEDYSSKGGTEIELFNNNVENLTVNVVYGSLQDDQSLGTDLNKAITFLRNDLNVLSNRETAVQSVLIMLNLKKGDIPENPFLGLSQRDLIGTSKGSIFFPSIIRQITNVFKTDDTVKEVNVREISFEEDYFKLDFDIVLINNIKIKETLLLAP